MKEIQSSDEFYDAPISIEDAASMFRRKIGKNEKPYTQTMLRNNNALIDEWKKNVLTRLSVGGKIAASKVYNTWVLFEEGRNISYIMKNREEFEFPSENIVRLWVDRFEKEDILDLAKRGFATVGYAWNLVLSYIRHWYALKKWEAVYSKSDDPVDWIHDAEEHRKLFNGEEHPFWDATTRKDVEEKIGTILGCHIEPAKAEPAK